MPLFRTLVLVGLLLPSHASAHAITRSGTWSETVDSADLTAGAGSDVTDTYDSSTSQITLTLSEMWYGGSPESYTVSVRRSTSTLPSGVRVWVRRSADGSGTGWISGGTSFQEVTSTNTTFFTGYADRSGVTLQLRFTGVELSTATGTTSATIVYTVS